MIGEAARRISSELKARNPAIPWTSIYGFRNHIAHEYFSLDLDIVWQTVTSDVPLLESQVRELMAREPL